MTEKEFSKGQVTAEDVKAMVEARVRAAIEKAKAKPKPEVAEPYEWWNLYSYGPLQNFQPNGPLPPNQVIKVGEPAWVTTVLVLNWNPILPPPPGMSPGDLLSNFGLPYQIEYQTANLSAWALGGPNAIHAGNLVPGTDWYVDVLPFTAGQAGMFEMNICARILGNPPVANAPRFAGFARWIGDFDPELFWPGPTPGWHYELPLKFMVYA